MGIAKAKGYPTMKKTFNRLWVVTGMLSLGMSVAAAPRAKADLVLEEGQSGERDVRDGDDSGASASEEREVTRKVVRKSKAVETTREVQAEIASDAHSESGEMAPAQKSELVRRKRMREEMKNEDLLQQRLEELRLRDEERRTKKVLKSTEADEERPEPKKAARAETEVVLEEEVVIAPVNEAPRPLPPAYQMSAAPAGADQVRSRQSGRAREADLTPAPVPAGPRGKSEAEWHAADVEGKSFAGGASIAPRFGFASIANSDFQFSPKFSLGLGLGFDVSENIGLEFGYTYAETGVSYQNNIYQNQYGYGNGEELSYKQHIFDAILKLYFLDTSSRVRPYVGGGAGYAMGSLNYSDRIQQINKLYGGVNSQDYELKSFLGILTAGLDLKVAENVSIGAAYKYMRPLSSSEDNQLNTGAFYSQYYDSNREYIRSSLKDSSTSIFQIAAAFTF